MSIWLQSPELLNPVKDQTTQLQPTQDIFCFQQRYRYLDESITLVGVETTADIAVRVPTKEAWEMLEVAVLHTGVGNVDFTMGISQEGLTAAPIILTRQLVGSGVLTPLMRAPPYAPTLTGDARHHQLDAFIMVPGTNFGIGNVDPLAAGDIVTFQAKYRLAPIPIEIEAPPVGQWVANAI